ncbi:MAG: hypothetical protein GKR86_13215 [Ilumatobacter sp.]|nr:hypothetical protein [Ilumatobacter sp.]
MWIAANAIGLPPLAAGWAGLVALMIGRAGTMAVAVLMVLGMSWSDALAQVASDRRGAGPEVGSQSELIQSLAGFLAADR